MSAAAAESPWSWAAFNSEESWLPFIGPLLFWVWSYLYCQPNNNSNSKNESHQKEKNKPRLFTELPWHEWHELHNIHNMGAIVLGGMSLYFQDDGVFNERVVILFNLSYFCVDLIDTASRHDIPFVLHALFCLVLGCFNYTTPLSRALRMNSKAAMLELSSPFLHVAKRTRVPWHFVLFALSFTLCRIVWIPIMMKQLVEGTPEGDKLEPTDVPVILVGLFYLLNWFWYLKILRILVTGGGDDKKDGDKSKDDEKKRS